MEVRATSFRINRIESDKGQIRRKSSRSNSPTNFTSNSTSENDAELEEMQKRLLPNDFSSGGDLAKRMVPLSSAITQHLPVLPANASGKPSSFLNDFPVMARENGNLTIEPALPNDLGSSDSAFDLGADVLDDANNDSSTMERVNTPGAESDNKLKKDWLKTPVKIAVPTDDDADDEAAEYLDDGTSALLSAEQIDAVGRNVHHDQRLVKLLQNKLKTQICRSQTARRQSLIKRERLRHYLKKALYALEAEQLRSRTLQSKLDDECNNLRSAQTEIAQLASRMQTFELNELELRKRIEMVKDSVEDAVPCVTNEDDYAKLRQLKRSQLSLRQLVALNIYEDTRQLHIELQSAKKVLRESQTACAGFASERRSFMERAREQDNRVQLLNAELHAARAQLHTEDRRLDDYDQLVAERDAVTAKNDEYKQLLVDLQPRYETMLTEADEMRRELDGTRQRVRLLQDELEYARNQCASFKASALRLETTQKSDQDTISRLRAQIDEYQAKYIDGSSSARAEYEKKLSARVAEVQAAAEKQIDAVRMNEQKHYERELDQRDREITLLREDSDRMRKVADEEHAKRDVLEEKLRQAVDRYNWDTSQLEAELNRVRIELSTAQLQAEELLESDSRARDTVEEITRRAVDLNAQHSAYRARIEAELMQLQSNQKQKQPERSKQVEIKYADFERGLEQKFQTLVETLKHEQAGKLKAEYAVADQKQVKAQQQRLAMLNEAAAEVVRLKNEVRCAMARKHQIPPVAGEKASSLTNDHTLLRELHGINQKSDEAFNRIIVVGSRVPSAKRDSNSEAVAKSTKSDQKSRESGGGAGERRRQTSANSPPFHRPPPARDSAAKRRVNSATEDNGRQSPRKEDDVVKGERRSSSKPRISDEQQVEKRGHRDRSESLGRRRSSSLSSSENNCLKLLKQRSSLARRSTSKNNRQSSVSENIPSEARNKKNAPNVGGTTDSDASTTA